MNGFLYLILYFVTILMPSEKILEPGAQDQVSLIQV